MNLGQMIDKLITIKAEKAEIAAQEKALGVQCTELEAQILEHLKKEDLPGAKGKKGSVSRSETIVGTLKDWELLTKYIKRTGNFQLFERRISAPAFRELLQMKGSVPGVEAFTKVSLRFSSTKE